MKICPFCAEEIQDKAIKCKHCGEMLDGSRNHQQQPFGTLTRSRSDCMLMGVCGGLAKSMNMDSSVVRLLTVLIVFFSGIFIGIIAYIVMGAILPEGD